MKFLLCLTLVILGCQIFLAYSASQWTSENGRIYLNGVKVDLKGLSWFGFETSLYTFHGLWQVDYNFLFDFMATNKFNALRIPFSLDMVLNDPMPVSINYGYCSNNISCNLGLKGLTSLQVLDTMIQAAASRGIAVMLDLHSFEPDAYQSNGLWYDASHPVPLVIKGWSALVQRYAGYSNILSVDLKNEPFACTWDKGEPLTDWRPAAEMLGNILLGINPNILIFVEGVASDPPCENACFFGGNLKGARDSPVNLSIPNKLVYSPHCYGPSVYPQPYFSAPNFPSNMPAIWDSHFGYLRNLNSSAVMPGEWGGHIAGTDGVWLNAWVGYLRSKDMRDSFFWCLNPDSGDTGGLLANDWVTPNVPKLNLLTTLQPNPSKLTFT